MKYYGQRNLDKHIHENFISKPFIDGTFLELGAIDGIRFSNTKFFEDNMGFNKGILIEPDPISFQRLVKNRPNCQCFNTAIHSSQKEVVFLQSHSSAVGCVENVASIDFKSRFHKNSQKVTLPATILASILKQSKLQYIDFFSLDVEGSEFECLKSWNWEIPIGLLCIEITQDRKEIENILHANGLTLIDTLKQGGVLNSFYFNKNYFRKHCFTLKL